MQTYRLEVLIFTNHVNVSCILFIHDVFILTVLFWQKYLFIIYYHYYYLFLFLFIFFFFSSRLRPGAVSKAFHCAPAQWPSSPSAVGALTAPRRSGCSSLSAAGALTAPRRSGPVLHNLILFQKFFCTISLTYINFFNITWILWSLITQLTSKSWKQFMLWTMNQFHT